MSEISVVILAAGLSRRMKQSKQLSLLAGVPLILHTARLYYSYGFGEIIAVLGNEAERISDLLKAHLPAVKLVINSEFRKGMGTSLASGVKALSKESRGVLVALGDMPLISSFTIEKMLLSFDNEPDKIVVPVKGERRGNPVIFPSAFFHELEMIEGDAGGSVILKRYPEKISYVETDDNGIFWDMDTPEDYEFFKKRIELNEA